MADHYEYLGLAPGADGDAIQAAIQERRLIAGAWDQHPEPGLREHAARARHGLDAAVRVLLDPARRSVYDAERLRPGDGAAATVGAAGWRERAEHFLENDNAVAAQRVAQEAVRAEPGNAAAWTLRGRASAMLGNYPDAEYELAEAARLDPTDSYPVALLGGVYAAQRRVGAAIAKYDQALSISPGNLMVATSKAELLVAAGEPEKAIMVMEPVVVAHPGVDDCVHVLALAYHDSALGRISDIPGVRHTCTEERHVVDVERALAKIDQLHSNDQRVKGLSATLRDLAEDGRASRWDTGAVQGILLLGGIVFIVLSSLTWSGGAGLLCGLPVAGGLTYLLIMARGKKPGWKLNKKQWATVLDAARYIRRG